MRTFVCVLGVVGFFLTFSAKAEYCWMVGCKDLEGFIVTYTTKEGKKASVFKGSSSPPVGSEATLVSFVSMSNSPPSSAEEGSYNLGPGFVVKILGYVGKGKEIAHIKIINDDLKK